MYTQIMLRKISLILVTFILISSWDSASATGSVSTIVFGAPGKLQLLGNKDNKFGIIPPCLIAPNSDTYNNVPCIKSVQLKSDSGTDWKDFALASPEISQYLDPYDLVNRNTRLEQSSVDMAYFLTGGSASLWQTSIKGENKLFLIEARTENTLETTLSLNLIPVEITNNFSNSLSDSIRSKFIRTPFPENISIRLSMYQSHYMQPLKFVTTNTGHASVLSTAGPTNQNPEFIFEGQPEAHSVIEGSLSSCSDPVLPLEFRAKCDSNVGGQIEIRPWDRSILTFFDDSIMKNFQETSQVEEWAFHGGQFINSPDSFANITGCNFPSIFGVMSTNAPVYSIAPPKWDKRTNSLNFSLANSHLDKSSTPQKGFFEIEIPLSSAKCIWKLSSLGISANVEVTSGEGNLSQVVTSTVASNPATNKIKINISGFGFSSPKISIKLVQELKEIKCKRGLKTTVVKAIAPKCPSGYVKL